VQAARKPNSVLSDHSSRRAITDALQQPTRRFRLLHPCGVQPSSSPCRTEPVRVRSRRDALRIPAYLVLLRVGFTMPPALLPARWALTPPFHPYLKPRTWVPLARVTQQSEAVCFLLHWPYLHLQVQAPDVIRHTALRSSDFPPPLNTPPVFRQKRSKWQRSPGRLHLRV